MTFLIISPVYNAEDAVEKCIDSVMQQTYSDFKQIIIDDHSTDNTLEVVKNKIKDDSRFVVVSKDNRYGALHSHFIGTNHLCGGADKEDVIAHLDGDDWFSTKDVLQKVHDVYEKTECWATYGTYQPTNWPQFPMVCAPFDPSISFTEQVKRRWIFSQLRTFKKFLWDRLTIEDFTDSKGGMFTCACDVAIFLPILEMATHDKVQYISEVLYIYNRETLNDDKWNLREQARCAWEVIAKTEQKYLK